RPILAVTTADTVRFPSSYFDRLKAALRPGRSARSDHGPGDANPLSVSSVTPKMASAAVGFMITIHPLSPRSVVPSGTIHAPDSVGSHCSAAIPDSDPPASVIQLAPIHPPKYSTSADDSGVAASTATRTSAFAGTVTSRGGFGLVDPMSVTRASTDLEPGFVSESSARHPLPPPCGQNHVPAAVP